MQPLSSALKSSGKVLGRHELDLVRLATLRFDGSLEPRKASAASLKGKLYRAEAGEVVYSKIDLRNGAIGIVPGELAPLAFTAEFPIYKLNESKAVAEYVTLLFRSAAFRKTINGMVSGASGRKRVMPSDLLDVTVPLPAPNIQRAVVKYWQRTQLEIETDEKEAQRIEQEAQASFLEALGFDGGKPHARNRVFAANWKSIERWGVDVNQPSARSATPHSFFPMTTLGAVIGDLENGWSPKCHNRPASSVEWGVLKVGAVSFGRFNEHENKALPAALQPIVRHEVRVGDLLISRANVTRLVGACALVEEVRPRLMLCDKIFRAVWRGSSPIAPRYLNEVLKIPSVRLQIENGLTGTSPTMKNISKPALMALEFPLPPLQVQEQLADSLHQARLHADKLRNRASALRLQGRSEVDAMILGRVPPPQG